MVVLQEGEQTWIPLDALVPLLYCTGWTRRGRDGLVAPRRVAMDYTKQGYLSFDGQFLVVLIRVVGVVDPTDVGDEVITTCGGDINTPPSLCISTSILILQEVAVWEVCHQLLLLLLVELVFFGLAG